MNEASIPNPALAPLTPLVGEWKTVGTHPMVPGTTFHGHTSFSWLEGRAFLVMRSVSPDASPTTGGPSSARASCAATGGRGKGTSN